MFGEVEYKPAYSYSSVPLEEQMEALTAAVAAGKVNHIGVSNETAWGLTKFSQLGTCTACAHDSLNFPGSDFLLYLLQFRTLGVLLFQSQRLTLERH